MEELECKKLKVYDLCRVPFKNHRKGEIKMNTCFMCLVDTTSNHRCSHCSQPLCEKCVANEWEICQDCSNKPVYQEVTRLRRENSRLKTRFSASEEKDLYQEIRQLHAEIREYQEEIGDLRSERY